MSARHAAPELLAPERAADGDRAGAEKYVGCLFAQIAGLAESYRRAHAAHRLIELHGMREYGTDSSELRKALLNVMRID